MSKRAKFHFNPDTLSFEKIEDTLRNRLKKVAIHTASSLFLGFIFFIVFSYLFESPQEKQLKRENETLALQYELMDKRMDEMHRVLEKLQQRDDNLYRVIFQADPIPDEVRHHHAENDRQYEELAGYSTSRLLMKAAEKTDDLSKMIYVQSQSYDELVNLAKTNEEKLKHIPAIQPVLNRDLRRMASGYGIRIDPVYRTKKFHAGMDFTANVGTDVYATGDGTVTYAGWMQGYGNTIIIDHGFDYVTLYGHLSKTISKKGEKVKRGSIIGLVGNTGKSTGPHLHYEVRFKGKPQNPMNFYFLDLSPEEYDRMVQMAENAGQVLD